MGHSIQWEVIAGPVSPCEPKPDLHFWGIVGIRIVGTSPPMTMYKKERYKRHIKYWQTK